MPEGGRGWIGTTHTPWFGAKVSNDALSCPPSRNHLRGTGVSLTSSNPPSIFPVMISVRSSTGGQDRHDHHDTIHEISLPREIRGNGQLTTHY